MVHPTTYTIPDESDRGNRICKNWQEEGKISQENEMGSGDGASWHRPYHPRDTIIEEIQGFDIDIIPLRL